MYVSRVTDTTYAKEKIKGTLDIMIQRTGEQGQGPVLFVQNNFFYDAFFLKAIGMSCATWILRLLNGL